jgi:uncharacterized repeat protein (TIGR01451 family)/MYXO-CTERM domain-containing protein
MMRHPSVHRVVPYALLGAFTLVALSLRPLPAEAQARDAQRRFQLTQRGDITVAANSLLTCSGGTSGGVSCANARAGVGAARRNNDYTMARIDADGDASTFDSSSADLVLPMGATVSWAGLYWMCQTGDRSVPNASRRNVAKLRVPGGAYAERTADRLDTGVRVGGLDAYLAFDDVTSEVRAAGVGTYWVADVQCTNGRWNTWGGWALVVAYEDTRAPLRDLVVFDAFRAYGRFPVDVNVSGFLTPASGAVTSRVGFINADGDRGTGDTLRLVSGGRSTLLGEAGAAALNPTNDISNSTISRFAANVTARLPAYQNTLGFDADLFATTDALPNRATSAQIRVQTVSEEILGGIFTFATDVFAPKIDAEKQALDLNGGTLQPGDILEYVISATNSGGDPAIDAVLTDVLPAGVDFVPGTLRLAVTPLTDAAGDDVGEYDATTRSVIVRLGTGATASAGGTVAPGTSLTVRFRVRVQAGTPPGTTLRNQASVRYAGATLGSGTTYTADTDGDPMSGGTQPTDSTIAGICGDRVLTPPETCDEGDAIAGDGCGVTCRREVAITAPLDRTLTADATPTISGTGDPGATVVVAIDGASVGTTLVAPDGTWSFTPRASLADGTHAVRATATDTASNVTVAVVVFTVDGSVSVAILSPRDGSVIADATPDVTGTADPGASVSIAIDGVSRGTTTASAAGGWSIAVSSALADGPHELAATAIDGAGNFGTAVASFTVDTGTRIAIISPRDGATIVDPTPAVRGTTEPGASVAVRIDAVLVGMTTGDAAGDWTVTPSASLADGAHVIEATATDALGNVAVARVEVTLITDRSTFVTITRPSDGALIGDPRPLCAGTAEAGAEVAVRIDGVLLGTVVADASELWAFVPVTPLANGPHTLSVLATDAVDNTATDTSTFTIDTRRPRLTIVSPRDGSTIAERRPPVRGLADPGALVLVSLDGGIAGLARADSDGSWAIALTADLADGLHTAEATTTNALGFTTDDASDFTVDATAPAIAITEPPDGSVTAEERPTIAGIGEIDADVEVRVDGALVGTTRVAGDGAWAVTPFAALAEGPHIVFATARDAAGSVGSDGSSFTIDRSTFVTLTTPPDGSTIVTDRPTIGGRAEVDATVVVRVDGLIVGVVAAGPGARFSVTLTAPLATGPHAVLAVATDLVGNTADDESSFIVDPTLGDRDGDGVPDIVECPPALVPCPDSDGDGAPDIDDPDDDGDGLLTADERPDGVDVDTDGDGLPDYLDVDDDGDGVPTATEAPGGLTQDTDLDGIPDHLDEDDDGDGIPTIVERPGDIDVDTDGDGLPDYLDADDDGDGIPTARERADGLRFGNDVDGDGFANWLDTDSDGDGLLDAVEGIGDSDGDGIPDYLDPAGGGPTDGGVPDGSIPDGSVMDGGVPDGAIPDGAIPDGAITDGGGMDGALDGAVDGAVADGAADAMTPTRPEGALVGGACGCAVPGAGRSGGGFGLLGLAGLVALALWRGRRRALAAALCVAVVIAVPVSAVAQSGGFALDQFRASELTGDGFAISRPTTPGPLAFGAQLALDYANDPLVLESRVGDPDSERAQIVAHQLVGTLGVSLGLGNRVAVYGQLPVTLWMEGDATGGIPNPSAATPGDAVLGARARLLGDADDLLALGVQLGVSLPLAETAREGQSYVGDRAAVFLPRLLAELRFGERVRLALNLGARARRDTAVQGLTVGNELTGGAGLTVSLVPKRLELVGEIYGATAFDDAFARGNTPFEVLFGARGRPVCALSLGLAAGTGITRGYGSPDVRGVFQAGVTTEPCAEPAPAEPVVIAPRDSDDDGLLDPEDACPTDAEDVDGFEDADGCPDPDNDADQVPDTRDGAPNEPEDRDGFEDEDGVPDPDNDADGVPDTRDGAPNEPEDRDGFLDEDGVPDPDNDGDGILDAEDRCPLDPGPPTAQGCPVTIRVDRESGLIVILQRVEFETNGDVLLAPSIPVLEEVRAVLAANPNLDHLRIEGHTDDRGRDATNLELSRRRAATVVGWLVGHGIARERLESWGCGELHPTESNRTARGRQSNRRVEFHIMAGATPSEQLRRLVGCVETP